MVKNRYYLTRIRTCFCFPLIGGNLTAQSTRNHRGIRGGIQFQRCSRKLSCLFPPCCQSTPERLLAGVFMDQDKHKVNKKAKKKKSKHNIQSSCLVCKGFIVKRTVFPSKTKVGIPEQAREACLACLGRQPIRTQDSFHVAHLQDQP